MRKGIFLVSVLVFCFTGTFPKDGTRSACPLVKTEVERLPDMNIPRSAHSVFCVNGADSQQFGAGRYSEPFHALKGYNTANVLNLF